VIHQLLACLPLPKAEVIRRYDLLHQGAGVNGQDIARPAEFLLDSSGVISWVDLTEDYRVRAARTNHRGCEGAEIAVHDGRCRRPLLQRSAPHAPQFISGGMLAGRRLRP